MNELLRIEWIYGLLGGYPVNRAFSIRQSAAGSGKRGN